MQGLDMLPTVMAGKSLWTCGCGFKEIGTFEVADDRTRPA